MVLNRSGILALNLNTLFRSKKGLKLVHINCRSLHSMLPQLCLQFKHYDIICCSETWLSSEYTGSLFDFLGKKNF